MLIVFATSSAVPPFLLLSPLVRAVGHSVAAAGRERQERKGQSLRISLRL